jgi:plasmid maintenance system killer protein
MKKVITIFGVLLFTALIIASCNIGTKEVKEADIVQDHSHNENSNDPLNQINVEETKIFVSKFYASLELSTELNQKNYEEGGVKFNINIFNGFIDKGSIYSKERVSNLTSDYHDRYSIKLVSIDLIESDNNTIEVSTTVEYSVSELGIFLNEEKLSININQGNMIINKWEDRKVKKMEVAKYEGLENFNEKDFYKTIGSVNKINP